MCGLNDVAEVAFPRLRRYTVSLLRSDRIRRRVPLSELVRI